MFARVTPDGLASRRFWHISLVFAGAVALAIAVALAWIDPSAACALPAVVLSALVACRRYPGARTLAVLARDRRPRPRRPRSSKPCTRRLDALLPRGGRLLARSLAVRPPPAASRAAS